MKKMSVTEKIKHVLEPKSASISARLFVTREDGITVYDSVQNQSTTSVSALVSGLWQASEALMKLVDNNAPVLDFRLGYDTSSEGIFLVPFHLSGKRYFLGAIYTDLVNPGQLKRKVSQIKGEIELLYASEEISPVRVTKQETIREGFLFTDISDEEIDRLFAVGGI